ncbi:GDP-6-deoxy-D-lyxo-4-hexulose reductase [Pseudomonas putida]|jgi:GDP-4-dehydro-6-deoxy-D-mannose reductase|uniref:GDP-mannose 4,6-dehydratase n=1 Tax=Pseudomonas putida TaxID=303 RepID=UPI000E0DC2DF|nr:GDP-mannose 4,6-dehydratase [Pseudomonas putida]EKT4458272.1 GDP-mannose 4,6-dehydratase [Pseudomonas putida]EKT4515318.1 GDP-mannose 4,6-dehydratase [Pseudomonas putida]MBS5846861.1 GDP-mannose 4,6-dehydratase [Pseudomonas putida]MCE0974767.1 GDP-mannose 4,6-dehydratase [Pseudomonas putida]WQE55526.1 GDP-mannose 4,6-dehydratase [Pseudomonas putida]
MARILLTGANGFVGKVLQRRLLNSNHEVVGTVASTPAPAECGYQVMDICDRAQVEAVIQRVKPTHLVHLAAVSNVAVSFKEPLLTWHTNVIGTLNLMEGLKAHAPECFTLFVSSSEVYGESFKSGQLLDENATCVPMNPYAASKLAAEHAVMQYLRQGMPGVVVRPFNHIGPGQSADFVTASFARQIAWIEAGLQPPVLKVGNLDASRDFMNVHDVCEAYTMLLDADRDQLQHRTYNIASGASRQIRSVLQALLAEATVPITVQTDPDRLRPSDIPLAAGTNARIKEAVGWVPTTPLAQTVRDILDYWRGQALLQPPLTV